MKHTGFQEENQNNKNNFIGCNMSNKKTTKRPTINLKSTNCNLNPNIPHPKFRPKCEHVHDDGTKCDKVKAISSTKKDGFPIYRKVCYKHHNSKLCAKHGVKSAKEITAKKRGISLKELNNESARKAGFKDYAAQRRHYFAEAATKAGFKSVKSYKDHLNEQLAISKGFKSYIEYKDCLNEQLAISKGFKTYAEYRLDRDFKTAVAKGFASIIDWKNSKHPYLKYRKNYCENTDGRLGYVCTTTIEWTGMLDVDHIDGNPSNNNPINLQTLCKCCHAYKTHVSKDYLTPGRIALGIKY